MADYINTATCRFTNKPLTPVKSCCTDLCLESVPVCMWDQAVSWRGEVNSFRHQSSCWNQGRSVILRGRAPGQGRGVQREAGQRGGVTLQRVESLHMESCPLGVSGFGQQLPRLTVFRLTLRGLILPPHTKRRGALYPSFLYAVLSKENREAEELHETLTACKVVLEPKVRNVFFMFYVKETHQRPSIYFESSSVASIQVFSIYIAYLVGWYRTPTCSWRSTSLNTSAPTIITSSRPFN